MMLASIAEAPPNLSKIEKNGKSEILG